MKAGKIVKVGLISLIFLGLLTYVVYAMIFTTHDDDTQVCEAVELVVNQDANRKFIDEKEIENILKKAKMYPKGRLMNTINTQKIEETISKNELVSKVDCYKTSNGKLCIKIEQRVPVIFVVPNEKDGYFVDSQGKIIQGGNYVSNLVTASGYIDEKYASTKLADFGMYLQTDDFWNNQIEQIYVTKGRKGEHEVRLVPRVGEQVVYLGTLDDYQKKLQRLKIFYEKGMGTVGWNKYSKINLEYPNQIICTKKDAK